MNIAVRHAASKTPTPHEQWRELDLAETLAYPTLLLVVGQSNSILTPTGAQAHERLWERTRLPDGPLPNTLRLAEAARAAEQRVAWTRYDIYRKDYPQTLVDKAQYDFWVKDKADWTAEDWKRDADLVAEVDQARRPEDLVLFYATLGNVFLGTLLTQHLAAWGVRTILLAGYHLNWCIEQAARTARDIGFNPIVVGDATAAGVEADEAPTLQRIDTFFAPVISTDEAVRLLAEGAERRRARGWPTAL
ncbi:isochorismatase family protein [Methylopila henanensis]|uniref:Isochorismatase family protein n=1 Tax=Methylopila henanensis TaxID=873516 RepID=A0ABW4K594_9HYPH